MVLVLLIAEGRLVTLNCLNQRHSNYIKKRDVVCLPMRQLSTRDHHDTEINNYRSMYGFQQ